GLTECREIGYGRVLRDLEHDLVSVPCGNARHQHGIEDRERFQVHEQQLAGLEPIEPADGALPTHRVELEHELRLVSDAKEHVGGPEFACGAAAERFVAQYLAGVN